MDLKAGLANQSVQFAAYTTATGAAATVVAATGGLSLWYRLGVAGAKTAISPSDLATLETAHAEGGILLIEGPEHRLDLPDAAVAASALTVSWGGTATGLTIDGGTANLIGQANTATDVLHVFGTAQTAAPGAAGGLFIAGTNAATTITSAGGTALTLSSTGTDGHGLAVTGNGTGEGISATGGATGHGIAALGGSSSGYGMYISASGGNQEGLAVWGKGTGSGVLFSGQIGQNASGFQMTGYGTGHGMTMTAAGSGNDLNATTTNSLAVNATEISGDSEAADNLELQYDGTGVSGGTFPSTQDQVDGIGTATGAALSQDAGDDNYDGGISGVTSGTTKTGTQTNTYAATSVADGTAHIMTHAGQVVGIVYQFQAGGGTSPVAIEWLGLLNPINDTLTLEVWDHVGGAWETLGTRAGQTSTTSFTPKTLVLYARHMGTSVAELGNVYLQLLSAEAYDHIVRTDQVYLTYAVTSRTVGYAEGAVWVDSGGTAGSVDYVNATADNPAPWANALVVAASLGLTRFHIANDDTITLGAAFDDKTMYGDHYYLVLSDESINDSAIIGATITEAGTAVDHTVFDKCTFLANASTGPAVFRDCGFNTPSGSPFLATGTGEAVLVNCYSLVAGAGTPYFDFSGMTGGVNIRGWLGGSNTTLDAGNTMSLEVLKGGGQTVTTGGADVEIRADCRAITVTATAAETIQIIANTGPITLGDDGASTATINVYGSSSGVVDNTNGATVNDYTTTGALGGVVLADGAHGGSNAVLTLKNAVISGADTGLSISGDVAGVSILGGTTGIGLDINGGSSSGTALDIDSVGGNAVTINTVTGRGVVVAGSTDAIQLTGTTGAGLWANKITLSGSDVGGVFEIDNTNGPAIDFRGTTYGAYIEGTAGPGMTLIGSSGTDDLVADIQGDLSGSVGTLAGTVTLADGSLVLAKWDQTTVWPLVAVDSGATQVARTGADSDTLETLSDQIDDVNPALLITTTIATLASQTSFTLTAGSADDDAYNNALVVVTDQSTATQKALGYISDYTGATKTVTLGQDPGIFTFVAGDNISIFAWHPYIDAAISSVVSNAGAGSVEWEVLVEDSSSNPLDGAEVWFTTDSAGTNVVGGTLTTNASGNATFMIDAGTYYFWKQLSGYNFTNPETVVVS